MNDLEERGNDMIQLRSNSDFDVKCATIQFYDNSHNLQSDRWIELKLYMECQSEFGKASKHGSTEAVRILLFTSF
jgi:hypothetical protein